MHVNILTTTGYNWSNRCEFFTTLHKKQREDRGSSSPGIAGKTAPSISGNPVEAIVPDAVYRTFTRRCPSIRRLSRPDASDANTLYVYERNVNVHPQTGIARQTLLRRIRGFKWTTRTTQSRKVYVDHAVILAATISWHSVFFRCFFSPFERVSPPRLTAIWMDSAIRQLGSTPINNLYVTMECFIGLQGTLTRLLSMVTFVWRTCEIFRRGIICESFHK